MWSYDTAGNILSRTEYGYTTGSVEDLTPTDTVNYTYGDEEWGDLLTAYDGVNISYDEIGNPLSDGTWSYTWEHGRELASMTDGTATWSFAYDVNGLRTVRTNGSTAYSYVYNGGSLSKLTVGTDVLYFTYGAEGHPLTLTHNGTTYFYATNLQDDVVAILDSNGNPVVRYTYDAWGNILTVTDTSNISLATLNPLRYRGYVFDPETGLYYLQSRYYDPELGRFLNADAFVSTGQGQLGNNMFAYCNNNPVMSSDPTGRYAYYSHEYYNHAMLRGESGHTPYISEEEREFYIALRKYNSYTVSFHVGEEGNDADKLNVTFYPDSGLIHIADSYHISNRSEKLAVIYTIMRNENYDASIYGNDVGTMLMEWSGHNYIYRVSTNSKLAEAFLKWRGFDDPIESTSGVDFRRELSPSQKRNYELVTLWGSLDW